MKGGASRRCCPGWVFLQRRPAGCCEEAKKWWAATVLPRVLRFKRPLHHSLMLAARESSQSRVLPSAELAYETGLSAGSIAVLAHGHQRMDPHANLHRVGSPTGREHHRQCFGAKIGAPDRLRS